MIYRIVRMEFDPARVQDFRKIFDASKHLIRCSKGCLQLSLHQDPLLPNVYYTHSSWQSSQYLEDYRQSELFRTTWAATKLLFSASAQAFTLEEVEVVQ